MTGGIVNWAVRGMVAFGLMVFACTAGATLSHGQQPTEQPPAEKKPVIETPSMRLASARNVFMHRTHGNRIPFEVIRSTIEGWGRFTLVETPEKADLIIEIASTGDSGVQVSSSSSVSAESGQEEKSTSTRKDISPTDVRMIVSDVRNRRVLWTATETVKFAMKEKAKENNLVEAAERLASKFHERLEPPLARPVK
ncbi:MAG TPA: hypothetical protein VH724_18465 [Candidatus Angelobacter sp.]|nr:hypothetical protein [Candidatus Angelobacter sp.]